MNDQPPSRCPWTPLVPSAVVIVALGGARRHRRWAWKFGRFSLL